MTRKFPILIFLILSILTSAFFYQKRFSKPLLSPIGNILNPLAAILHPPRLTSQKVVYGFLPYWTINDAQIHYPLVTHLAYFGVDFDTQGKIVTHTPDGYQEPGYRHLKSAALSEITRRTKSSGNKTILVLRAMTQDIIENIVNNTRASQTAIDQALEATIEGNFDGINIDFEYSGNPSLQTKNNFSAFVQNLSKSCKSKLPSCVVSIDVFADSASKDRIWDYPAINPYVDHVIVMAYDFFRASSDQAGPVAPLRGSCPNTPLQDQQLTCLNYDVSQSVADFSRILLASKVILGVPFYGYQWRTAGENHLANTYEDTGRLATYKRVQELITQKDPKKVLGLKTLWDDHSMTPRLVFQDTDKTTQQIYYDDTRSLSLKYDLVNQSQLGGIGIWALGYEGNSQNIWKLIQAKFFTKSQ